MYKKINNSVLLLLLSVKYIIFVVVTCEDWNIMRKDYQIGYYLYMTNLLWKFL